MGMSAGGGHGGPNSEINVTPLVDVCLVLLIIFMVMIPRNVPEISVRIPPESKTAQARQTAEETLVIGLSKDGGILLNKNPLSSREELQKVLSKQLEFREKKVVFVDFEDDAPYGTAVEVLGVAKGAGAEVLGIYRNKERKVTDSLRGV